MNHDPFLAEQQTYYQARAPEYDEWFLRRGRYDRGPLLNERWFAETREVEAALQRFGPRGRVLELACGTGLWTRHVVRSAERLTAVDGSPEMLTLNRARLQDDSIRYVRADLFVWEPPERYDTVFFGFWLSHVPPERFEAFWGLVRRCLAPGGRVFFVDSLPEVTSTSHDQPLPGPDETTLTRRLNDGREFRIVKVFYEPEPLGARLRDLGWEFDVSRTASYFLYGCGRLATTG